MACLELHGVCSVQNIDQQQSLASWGLLGASLQVAKPQNEVKVCIHPMPACDLCVRVRTCVVVAA